MIENELSFLVKAMPELSGAEKKEIEQHYLVAGSNLRLRACGGRYEMTKKFRVDADDDSRKEEVTIPLSEQEYSLFLPLAHRSLSKTRWLLPLADGLTAELDVFHGPLEGLATVEVEFTDEDARASFVPPDWFGRDVSQEEWSGNSWLAGKVFQDVEPFLKKS